MQHHIGHHIQCLFMGKQQISGLIVRNLPQADQHRKTTQHNHAAVNLRPPMMVHLISREYDPHQHTHSANGQCGELPEQHIQHDRVFLPIVKGGGNSPQTCIHWVNHYLNRMPRLVFLKRHAVPNTAWRPPKGILLCRLHVINPDAVNKNIHILMHRKKDQLPVRPGYPVKTK